MGPDAELPTGCSELERWISELVEIPVSTKAVCSRCDTWFTNGEDFCAECAARGYMVDRCDALTGVLNKKVFVFDIVKQLQGLFGDPEMSKTIQMYTTAAEKYMAGEHDMMEDVVHSDSYRR